MVGKLEQFIFSSRGMSYIVGGCLVGYSGWCTSRFYVSKHWPRVDGRVLGMYPYYAWLGDDKERWHIDYEFDFNGKTEYGVQAETGTMWRWWMGDVMRDTVGTNEVKKGRLRPGAMVKVFVNPDNPRECALFRTADPTRNGAVMGIGMTFICGAMLCLPKNHRFEIVNKIRWFVRYRLMFNTKKTRVIDVIFARDPSVKPAWKSEAYVANDGVRSSLGLDSAHWDADVQNIKEARLKREQEEAAKTKGNLEPSTAAPTTSTAKLEPDSVRKI
ncbi:hypothetical protein DIPPA_18591 [Diplonema papillatum]|nr:hypothetical protein DIPPA_18591 [Diplonema papillatum]|eukprot:gene11526-17747_t